ncbi:hypothetical protein EBBID32_1100 [Sphingobium indicum BiD32]|uniref:DUF551 domain-containing protein n=1 Tax=Sphingobium indicum BiD32 TaxID=1301087 RepID=N1MJF6_9SPHN|nr:hypothetical protein [Sphingobium indicum]CCW15782.1 hypothetical protein EBBID32_1100 [Sphingobium indicum BiD32]
MTDILDLTARLDACWLDIMSPEDEARDDRQMLSRCANMISEASRALRDIGVPKPIDKAPDDDRWILAYDPAYNSPCQWVPATRCDDGWHDEGFNGIDPTMWVPLPDPQPAPSGWCKAEGHVQIAAGSVQGQPIFVASVIKPDGTQDIPRDVKLAGTAHDIRAAAEKWAKQLGIPVFDMIDANVVPFQRSEPTQ